MTEVEIAERTVATLTDKRERAALRVSEIAEERKAIGFAVHVDEDKAARAKLTRLNADEAAMAGELQSLDAALKEAGARLEASKAAAAAEHAREIAREISKTNDEALEHSVVLSDALHDAVLAINNLKACWDQFGKLGVTAPHQQQLKVNIVNVISGVLSSLPYAFETLHFDYLPVHRRLDVEGLFRKWHSAIRDRYVRPHLGEVEPAPAAAIPDDLSIPVSLRRELPPAEVQP